MVRVFYISLTVSIVMMLAGFFSPPIGVIDDSVLTAVGLLLMFVVIAQIPAIVKVARNGKNIKVTKGDFGVEVNSDCIRDSD